MHFGNDLAQAVGSGGVTVDQFVMQEIVAHFLSGQGEELIDGPDRTGAGGEVELDAVFIGVEPGVEEKRLELHAGTSCRWAVKVTDSADRLGMILVYE